VTEIDNRELRRRCAALVDGLDIPTPFDLTVWCEQLGRARNRPIHQLVMDLSGGGVCGLVVSTDHAEIVIVEGRTSVWHQRHIVLHELGHLLLGHERVVAESTLTTLLPHLDPEVVHRVLARTTYSETEEREAEMVATLIQERVSRWAPETADWANFVPGQAEVLRRVEESLRGQSLSHDTWT
jgi:hypothetical protein